MNSPNEITVVLLTKDRIDYAISAIKSLLSQRETSFQLVISDLSKGDSLFRAANEFIKLPNVIYKKRSENLKSSEHHYLVLKEISSKYFLVFHDDDIAYPNLISTLYTELENNLDTLGVGANAQFLMHKIKNKYFIPTLGSTIELEEPKELARRYFSFNPDGIAPFPGYMYRKECIPYILDTVINYKLGKYTDYLILEDILKFGKLRWLRKPLFLYRIHASNDSKTESLKGRLLVMAHLKKNYPDLVNSYRLLFYTLLLPRIYNFSIVRSIFLFKKAIILFIIRQGFIELFTKQLFATLLLHLKNKLQG